jgi:hypothetical protein
MQEFNLEKKFIWLMRACLIAFLIIMALGLAVPFFPEEDNTNPGGLIFISLFSTIMFGGFAILTWKALRSLPYADIATDEEGVWYKHLGKEQGLIPWGNISKIKERAYMQRLDLIDSNGALLLKVEYQLLGFEILRSIIFENIDHEGPELSRKEFKKGVSYHVIQLSGVLVFAALGIYVGANGSPILGYGAMSLMVAFIIYEYLTTAYGVRVSTDSFEVLYPLGSRLIDYPDVSEMGIIDEFHKGSRLPEVWIVSLKAKKPFKLKNLGIDSNVLLSVLQKALQE